MSPIARKAKKNAFRKAKEVLPEGAVLSIQRTRLEGSSVKSRKPSSYEATYSYSVVSAVYNVGRYLDDFFESMVSQTITHKKLKLIMVDDGSVDNSAEIIKEWQSRYPSLIEYARKQNGGQASARNLGLDLVGTDWVTFIDPDDFVSQTYFEEIDKTVLKFKDIQFATCRIVFYNEPKGEYFDKHPLRGDFKNDISLYNATDDFMPITLSASKSFFRISKVKELNLRFNEKIRPNFEDAHFLNRYLLGLEEGRIAYLRKPVYYYRKRENGSSTLDSSWSNPDRVSTVLRLGMFDLLKRAKSQRGYVPFFIQKTVLYDLQWYFKLFIGHEERTRKFEDIGFMDGFWDNLHNIFSLIDGEAIEAMPGGWLNYETKYACISTFKYEEPRTQIVYVERIDFTSKLMLVRATNSDYKLFANGRELTPAETKWVNRPLFGRSFCKLYMAWVPLPEATDTLSIKSGGPLGDIKLSVRGRQFDRHAQMNQIYTAYKKDWGKYQQSPDNVWLFMDRDTQADDNAEHLYRWMTKNHPEQKCYFVLRRKAADWARLDRENFNLIPFGSRKHEALLKSCSTIVSSHADGFVHSYFGDNFFKSKKFVFLQHGVTKDDLSPWINNKPINLMITAAQNEYDSITREESPYLLTKRQVALTGFPRHDSLIERHPQRRIILVMPTWRNSLSGEKTGNGNIRSLNSEFATSLYKRSWESLINNEKLRQIADKNDAKIVFFPHTNTFPYVENGDFSIPSHVEIAGNQTGTSIQQAFADALLMITDYSSTAFETAYLGKGCIYYQFDSEEFFGGMQAYAKGYFDYSEDGFGPVVQTEDDLITELQVYAKRDFAPADEYTRRIREFFPFRDGKCCERVYARIKELSDGKY